MDKTRQPRIVRVATEEEKTACRIAIRAFLQDLKENGHTEADQARIDAKHAALIQAAIGE